MNNSKRDLLVLFNQHLMTQQAIEHEVAMLHNLLYSFENLTNISIAHEIIDLNKHKIFKKLHQIKNILKQPEIKAFVFLNCKN